MNEKGKLYICPTPIGNLEDITLRAIKALKEVDLIACEDTRVTQKLLNHFEIKTKTISYHKFSEKQKSIYIIELLEQGKNVALVSDAGTPLISDPGEELVKNVIEKKIKIIPLPGASSLITAISGTYTGNLPVLFAGFLPKTKGEKERFFQKYSSNVIAIFESPNRLVKTLKETKQVLGNRNATVARELTKIHEEIRRDCLENLIEYYAEHPPKGEIVLIIEGSKEEKTFDNAEIEEKIFILKKDGYGVKEISKIISLLYGCSKKEVYEKALNILSD